MSNDFHQYLARQAAVGREKFRPGERRKGVIAHIQQELEEIDKAETQHEVAAEWTSLSWNLAGHMRAIREMLRATLKEAGTSPNIDPQGRLCGYDGEPTDDWIATAALSMITSKQHKNELRDFGDWRGVSEDVAIQHKEGIHD